MLALTLSRHFSIVLTLRGGNRDGLSAILCEIPSWLSGLCSRPHTIIGATGPVVGMTLPQILAFTIIFVMMALFAWGRWRYDLVAAVALMAAVIVGIVPPEQAFKGFSDDIVIIVGSALVVSAAVARSGVIERVARWLGPYLVDINRQIVALVGSVTLLSAFVKNVGALAIDRKSVV